jgi:peptidoglycan/LPS O-acetylase OafA/YrhL
MIRAMGTHCEAAPPRIGGSSLAGNTAGPALQHQPLDEATRDLTNLDALRSLAVLLVFTDHLTAFMRFRGLGDLGHLGVLLFFVHTALVLMFSTERLGLSGRRLYTVFLVRRLFRIYPLSILVVVLVVANHVPSAPWLGGFEWLGWRGVLSNILLAQNITHSGSILCVLWSLPFEVQMYAFLPFLFMLVCRFPSLRAISLIWLAGIALAGLEFIMRSEVDQDFLLLRYLPCFLAGVLAWRLMAIRKVSLPSALWLIFLLALVLLYRIEGVLGVYGPNWRGALHGALRNDHLAYLPPSYNLARDWASCGIAGLAVPFFSDARNIVLNALTRNIAKYSYGVYLCHVPMLWVCFSVFHTGNTAATGILAIFLTALLSIAQYHLIEDPAIQFGKHLSLRLVNQIVIT